jgi:hypothetical protein
VRAAKRKSREPSHLGTRAARFDRQRAPRGERNVGRIARPSSNLAPAVRAADRVDYWIRRQVVPLEDVFLRAGPRINPPPQRAWLSAIGQCLKAQYDDALAAPIPPRLAALVAQLEAQGRTRLSAGTDDSTRGAGEVG